MISKVRHNDLGMGYGISYENIGFLPKNSTAKPRDILDRIVNTEDNEHREYKKLMEQEKRYVYCCCKMLLVRRTGLRGKLITGFLKRSLQGMLDCLRTIGM